MDDKEFRKFMAELQINRTLRKAVEEAFINNVSPHRFHRNATFRYMRVKPSKFTHTPAFPVSIWENIKFFKPRGRGITGR